MSNPRVEPMKNLVKIGETWYAEVRVPLDVKPLLGRGKFRRTTGCKDRKNAEIEAAPWVAEWKKQIRDARANPEAALERLAQLRALTLQQTADEDFWAYEEEIDSKISSPTGKRLGWTEAELSAEDYLWDLQNKLKPSEYKYYHDIYSGVEGVPIGIFIEKWIQEEYSKNTPRTRQEARTAIKHVAKWFPTIKDFTVHRRLTWLRQEKRSKKTVEKNVGYVRSYWRWLRDHQLVGQSEPNPFAHGDITFPKTLANRKQRQPFSLPELKCLERAIAEKGDDELMRYFLISAYTGMRLAEIAQLTKSSIERHDGIDCIRVKLDAKTIASSGRLIPYPSHLEAAVTLPDTADPADEGMPVGKRFGRLKTAAGYGPEKVFHSIRKTVSTVFEQQGISEGIAADILGHEKQTMTYGLYSGGTSIAQRNAAIIRISGIIHEALSG